MTTLLLITTLAATDFLAEVKTSGTQGLVILKDGSPIESFQPGRRVSVQSVTKPFVSLAAGRLWTEGKLKSLDLKVGEVLPELAKDPKGAVTLRHLLSHSSGIRDARDSKGRTLNEFMDAKDVSEFVAKLPLDGPPGQEYKYSNVGVALLSLALERIAGEPLHLYLRRTLLRPMDIQSDEWRLDKRGRSPFYFGLSINAEDLAKIGQLIINDGQWQGQQLLAPDWIRLSTQEPGNTTNPRLGLIWFFQTSTTPGAKPTLIQHTGDGGNYLLIFPKHNLVAVRLRPNSGKPDPLKDFPNLVVDRFIRQ